jgi:hypothetical protein
MHFLLPNFPCWFEIPDDWLNEAGFINFSSSRSSFRHMPEDVAMVRLGEIEPPRRVPTSPNDFRGFDRERMVRVLREIATDVEIKAVPLVLLPELDDRLMQAPEYYRCRTYSYRIQDGYHRFYASVAAGFLHLPATVSTVPELVQQCRDLGWCQ